MNVLIAGAHGDVGQRITDLLSRSEHAATAMVRDEDQVPEMEEFGVETVVADLREEVTHAVEGHDAIVFAAGSSGEDVEGVDRDGAIRTIEAAEELDVPRFVMLSAMNADEPEESPDALRDYLIAKGEADDRLRSSELAYTIVRPGSLTNDPGTGSIEAAEKLDERGEITRDDVAQTLVATLDMDTTYGRTFEILEGDTPIYAALEELGSDYD